MLLSAFLFWWKENFEVKVRCLRNKGTQILLSYVPKIQVMTCLVPQKELDGTAQGLAGSRCLSPESSLTCEWGCFLKGCNRHP